jgi:hypothetical protein
MVAPRVRGVSYFPDDRLPGDYPGNRVQPWLAGILFVSRGPRALPIERDGEWEGGWNKSTRVRPMQQK